MSSDGPTPARLAFSGDEKESSPRNANGARTVIVDGNPVCFVVSGQVQAGRTCRSGVTLLHLAFHEADTPEALLGETLVPARSLDSLDDQQLEAWARSARALSSDSVPAD